MFPKTYLDISTLSLFYNPNVLSIILQYPTKKRVFPENILSKLNLFVKIHLSKYYNRTFVKDISQIAGFSFYLLFILYS